MNHAKLSVVSCMAVLVIWMVCSVGCRPAVPPPDRASGPSSRSYQIAGRWYHPLPDAHGFRERGMASWYGKPFHGRKTASGERYDMYAMTAAHKTLPLGTWVEVRNLRTGETVVVRVNDRGPFVAKRIIDLSYAAAKKVSVVGPGTAKVEIRAVGRTGAPGEKMVGITRFCVQVGAFRSKQNATALRQRLEDQFGAAHMVTYAGPDGTYYRVRVGNCRTRSAVEALERKLILGGYTATFIVSEP